MARVRDDQPLVPSILDRLLDDQPDVAVDTRQSRSQLLRQLKASIRRDLENLLNTRSSLQTYHPGLKELEESLINYGLPDVVGAGLMTHDDRDRFRELVEAVIRRNEPRFQKVSVHLLSNDDKFDRTLRFRIDALMYAHPDPEPLVFDSLLHPVTATFDVANEEGR